MAAALCPPWQHPWSEMGEENEHVPLSPLGPGERGPRPGERGPRPGCGVRLLSARTVPAPSNLEKWGVCWALTQVVRGLWDRQAMQESTHPPPDPCLLSASHVWAVRVRRPISIPRKLRSPRRGQEAMTGRPGCPGLPRALPGPLTEPRLILQMLSEGSKKPPETQSPV